MFFLSPLALLGLVAVLVPPLLHLFQRRQPPVVEFPAVRYLQETKREAQRTVKLQHLLLMLLRIAGVLLIVLAAARPVIPGGLGALHEPTALVLVLDHSLSSGAVKGGTRVLDDLAARARETLRDAQAGDAVWLVGADGVARRGAPAELLEAVTVLRPDPRRLDLSAAVRQGARLLATSGYARREIHVLSDFQASALEETGDGPRETGDTSIVLQATAGDSLPSSVSPPSADSSLAGLSILVYHPPGDPPTNRGVTMSQPWPALWLPGPGVVRAAVGGGPMAAGARALLSLSVDGRPGARALSVNGGDVELGAPALGPGWHVGEVAVEPDELRADDSRSFAVRVVAPSAVAAGPDAGSFVAEALGVLAGAGRIRGGGGAGAVHVGTAPQTGAAATVVLPPPDPAALGATNRALANAGVRWRFGARREREDSLVAAAVPELAGIRVGMRWRLEPVGGEHTGDVLARAGTDAWLVRHERVVLVGSRLVPEETTLPLSGAFVPFVSALVNRIARGESGILEAAPGDAVTVPARVTALASGDSLLALRAGEVVTAPVMPGSYPLRAGADTAAMLVVSPDARESDLTRATPDQAAAAWRQARVTVTDNGRELAARRFRGAGHSELTGWLLAAALLVLIVESLLAAGGFARFARS